MLRSKCLLNIVRSETSTTFLGRLFQCLTILSLKKSCLMSSLSSPWCSFVPQRSGSLSHPCDVSSQHGQCCGHWPTLGIKNAFWNLCSWHSSCQLSDPELRWVNKKLIQEVVSGWEANRGPGIWHEDCTIGQGHSVSHRFYVYHDFSCTYHIGLLTIHPDALETWQQTQEAVEWQHARLPGFCLNAERGPGCKKNHWDENSSLQCYKLSYILSAGYKFCPAFQWVMRNFYKIILTLVFDWRRTTGFGSNFSRLAV